MADVQAKKPAVLIVGGLGFVGRHLALYIHENNLASEVRLVDKVLPQLAWLAPEFQEACSKDKFVQADASREQHFPRIFDRANGEQFDYVINCGGETRHSQPDDVYEVRSYALTVALGREVARRDIRSFVECSTAHVYKGGSSPRKEDDKLQPWHKLAKWKMKASEELQKIPNLHYCLLRLPHVYGEYDSGYFAMGICLARVHLELQKNLELLYTKDLKINTIYIKDAAGALWKAAEWRASAPTDGSAPIAFNVVDHGDTRQEHIADALSEVFGMKVEFLGSLASQFAKMNLDDVVDDMNEECLQGWADLLEEKKIERPGPISPFLERDVLRDQDMSIDGTLFEKTTGWKPTRERFDADAVRAMVESYKRMGWWP
ncbi:NAD dependent epimerase/dehydratase family protein [Aspergillus uvarum CBS 121591]|uniref:NAD dependent epimerase/dehydratase family protein n=1 Tax=Aspergillus uvarum CBS 121591 TaxID=1448315 RepID=A0A319CAV4_9EURO|nr:NAD dependent epimerase/dehydratase family protein [Aspergillus uvarum CBS 121591]PYH82936.1 NAD dependent epimerase/dehydratase family protein [Aspergillus uvarum CBS 121591]